jgi:hypothetical protein
LDKDAEALGMPTARACPGLDEYRRLASGQMTALESDALLEHVEGCTLCARR